MLVAVVLTTTVAATEVDTTAYKSDSDVLSSFKIQAPPLIHDFIFSKYADFAESELTFRDLKKPFRNSKQFFQPPNTLCFGISDCSFCTHNGRFRTQ